MAEQQLERDQVQVTLGGSGECRIYSTHYDDIYFNPAQGKPESEYVFFRPNQVEHRLFNDDRLSLIETGFGSGLNFFLFLEKIQSGFSSKLLRTFSPQYFSVDSHPLSAHVMEMVHQKLGFKISKKISSEFYRFWKEITPGINSHTVTWTKHQSVSLHFFWGELTSFLNFLEKEMDKVDVWFLDGFSPAKNPEMWDDSLFEAMNRHSGVGTTFSTFTAAGWVKKLLEKNGFSVNKLSGFGRKREMLAGHFSS